MVKHWRFFEPTKNFLRQRYAQYGILGGPSLTFDCLVPKVQKPLRISAEKKKKFRIPKHQDPPSWYTNALEMLITAQGEVGFVCRSTECQRTKCRLHRNKKTGKVADLIGIIQMFDGYRSPSQVVPIIQALFGPEMSRLETRGAEEKKKIRRYAVSKAEIIALIERFAGMRRQHIPKLIQEAEDLIRNSEVVEVTHSRVFLEEQALLWPSIIEDQVLRIISGAAVRLYLWLIVRQEEAAGRNEFGLMLTDAEVARLLGITRQTAGNYRKHLQELGLLTVKGDRWTVGYGPKSQFYT
jgi:DNA-binding CsgD family transcriptional regulator